MEKIRQTPQEQELTPEDNLIIEAVTEDLKEHQEETTKPEKKSRLLKSIALGVAAMAVGLTLNHLYRFRNKIEKSFEKNRIEFTHEDKQTEHILNVMSGKENFNEQEKRYISISMAIAWCKLHKIPIPENINSWTIEEIEEYSLKFDQLPNAQPNLSLKIKKYLSDAPFFMKRLNDTLWTIEERVGSPLIRWIDKDNVNYSTSQRRSSQYDPITNTIYISPEHIAFDINEEFVAEVAHAKQFTDQPTYTYISTFKDGFETLAKSIKNSGEYSLAYDSLYSGQGTNENEAHIIIEPILQKQIDKSKKLDTKDHP